MIINRLQLKQMEVLFLRGVIAVEKLEHNIAEPNASQYYIKSKIARFTLCTDRWTVRLSMWG